MVTGLPVSTDNLPFAAVARKDVNTCGEHAGLYEEKAVSHV